MASFLDKIVGGFRSGGKSVLGVDISSSSIKIVQIRKEKGAAVLETYGELALGPYSGIGKGQSTSLSPEKLSGALQDLLGESNVTTKNCGVAIPMSSSLINLIKMPDVGKKRLETMVPIEMRKYVPVPISEVVIDWKVVPKENSIPTYASRETLNEEEKEKSKRNQVEVFVVAIHKETIENYTQIVRNAGLTPSFLEIEIFSTVRTISHKPGESVMIIDFGAGTTKVYIIESGIVKESHTIGRGSQNITVSISKALGVSLSQAENIKRANGLEPGGDNSYQISSLVVEDIFHQANRVLLNYQKEFNKNVSQIVLTGGGSIIKGLISVANKSLSLEAQISDPFSTLKYPAFLKETLKLAGPEFAVAIGVALRKIEELN